MVLLPDPDTPITTSAHSVARAVSRTEILRQRRFVQQPDGLAFGLRAVRRQVLAVEYAGQDRPLSRAACLEQHFAAGGERRQCQRYPRHERLDIRLWDFDHPTRGFFHGRISWK